MRIVSTAAAAVAAATWVACVSAAGGSSSTNIVVDHSKRMVATRSHLVHAPPTKRQPATDDVQGSIVAQAANDPIGAAAAAQGLDNVKNYLQGGDQAQYTLIQDDANNPSAQYPWNQNVGTNPNANAQAGANADGNSQGWVGLPQLQMFDLKRDQVIKENATQVSAASHRRFAES